MMKLVKRTFDTVLGLCLEGVVERCEREGA